MNIKKGDKVIVKSIQYEVLNVVEEAASSIPPKIKSYSAVYLHRVDDESSEPSLVLQLKNDEVFSLTKEKVLTKLKESEFKVIS